MLDDVLLSRQSKSFSILFPLGTSAASLSFSSVGVCSRLSVVIFFSAVYSWVIIFSSNVSSWAPSVSSKSEDPRTVLRRPQNILKYSQRAAVPIMSSLFLSTYSKEIQHYCTSIVSLVLICNIKTNDHARWKYSFSRNVVYVKLGKLNLI